MKQVTGIPLLLLILCAGLLIVPVMAVDITMSAGSSEYYFGFGESADVPLAITSTFDHDIDGTIQFTTTEQLQNAGSVMMSTKKKVYSHTVFPGASQITISAGTSDVEKTVRVQVAYDYTDPSAIHVAMPEILIHFVAQPPQSSGSQSSVTSTSSAGTGNVPTSSSVQIVQQSVSSPQQSGRDGTVQQALSNGQLAQDTSALKEQLQKEAERAERDKAAFEEALSRDPLLASVNESLAADGFSRASQATNPESGRAGTFSQEYRNAAGETATLAGRMEDRVVPSVTETSASPVNVTAPVAANITYQSAVKQLNERGFARNTSTLTIASDGGSMVNLTYQNPQGKRAFVNATTDGVNVTQLTVAVEPDAPFDYLPVLAAIAAGIVILIAAWVLYRRFHRQGAPVLNQIPTATSREPFDHRKVARELLAKSEIAYGKHQYADACGLAGQALRLFLSGENGVRHEMTNTELLAFLHSIPADSSAVRDLLDRCTDVEFARGTLGTDEFPQMVASIRTLIDGKS